MKKNKHILFSVFFAIFLLKCEALYALEVPSFGAEAGDSLPGYVVYVFKTAIGIAIVIAALSFAVGAVQYIISLDSAEANSSAKDRMKGAILGLILTVSSFIIINTINPDLTEVKLEPLPSTPIIALPPPPSGVYYYTGSGCSGDVSSGHTGSENNIDNKFAGKIRSVRVVRNKVYDYLENPNDPLHAYSDPFYIIIFHQFRLDELGGCNRPIIAQSSNCYSVENPDNTGSVDITPIRTRPGSPGDGVTFYSEAHGYASGQLSREGVKYIRDWTIVPIWSVPASGIVYDYKDATNVSEDYKRVNKTFQDRPGSIQMTGNYLVALYSRDPENANSLVCQTFKEAVPDLNAIPITTTGGSNLENVYIMPNN